MKAINKTSIGIVCVLLCVPFLHMINNLHFMGWAYMAGGAFYVAILFAIAVILIKYATSKEQMQLSGTLLKSACKYWAIAFAVMMLILVFTKYFIIN